MKNTIYGQTNSVIGVSMQVLQHFFQKYYIAAFVFEWCNSISIKQNTLEKS